MVDSFLFVRHPYDIGDRVFVECAGGDRIPGVVAADSVVLLECVTGPGAIRARVRHRRQDAL